MINDSMGLIPGGGTTATALVSAGVYILYLHFRLGMTAKRADTVCHILADVATGAVKLVLQRDGTIEIVPTKKGE